MKKGKRLIFVVFTVILCMLFSISSYAQTTLEKAQALDKLSIYKGSGGDYRLEDQLKRNEAATLIVRLMGLEKYVNEKAELYRPTTFPDVVTTQWYAPYVGYCSSYDIISGSNDGKFYPENNISEMSFLKLVLCSMGYVYNTDFTWNEIYTKAYNEGLVTDIAYLIKKDDNNNFTRGQAVEICYNALNRINKNTNKKMIFNLIDNEVITREVAIEAGVIVDTVTTAIKEIDVIDSKTISVKFNEDIEEISESNITVCESDDFTKTLSFEIEERYSDSVILKTAMQKPGTVYTVIVDGVEDTEGNVSGTFIGPFVGYELGVDNIESDFFRINSIEPLNNRAIKIYFTHPVNINSEILKYYKIYDDGKVFADGIYNDFTVKVSGKNSVILTLVKSVFLDDKVYTLELDGNMPSAYGVRLNDGADDKMNFVSSDEEVEQFALLELIPYDKKTLLLPFNKEINPFLAEQIYNFYITDADGNPVKIARTVVDKMPNSVGKVLFVCIEGVFIKNKEYTFVINNLSDITRQEYIIEKSYKFKAGYGSEDNISISRVRVLNNQLLEVSFTNPPDEACAKNVDYYTIRGVDYSYTKKPVAIFYDPDTDPQKVRLYLSAQDKLVKNREYEVRLDSKFTDYLGNTVKDRVSHDFDGTSSELKAPTIDSAVAISSDAVKITFNRELALDAPNILPNNYVLSYTFNGIQLKKLPLSVTYIDAKTFILKFDTLEYEVEYTIEYENIKDYMGNVSASSDDDDKIEFMLIRD